MLHQVIALLSKHVYANIFIWRAPGEKTRCCVMSRPTFHNHIFKFFYYNALRKENRCCAVTTHASQDIKMLSVTLFCIPPIKTR